MYFSLSIHVHNLSFNELMILPGFKDKKAHNLLNAIQKSKSVNFASFIYALGIANVGKKTAKDLTKHYNTLQDLQNTLTTWR